MKRLALVLAALAIIGCALLAWTPAALVLPRLVPAALSLQDVRGTFWHGQAGQVHWQGRALGTLHWAAAPSSLLRGELEVQLRLDGPLPATARLRQGLANSRFEQVRLELPAHWLDGVLATPALQPRGTIEVNLAQARFAQGQWQALEGQAHWRTASLTGVAAAALGELHANFSLAGPARIEGRLNDEGGPLALAGRFEIDAAGYRVQARLRARDPALQPVLAWLGQPAGDGRYLELQGLLFGPERTLATY